MVNVYTGDWLYLSLDDARLLHAALVAVGSTDTPILHLLEQHITKLEGVDTNVTKSS